MFWNLKFEMQKAGITSKQLAGKIGISEGAMNKKLNGHFDFKLAEVRKILAIFPQQDWEYLFEDENAKVAG